MKKGDYEFIVPPGIDWIEKAWDKAYFQSSQLLIYIVYSLKHNYGSNFLYLAYLFCEAKASAMFASFSGASSAAIVTST